MLQAIILGTPIPSNDHGIPADELATARYIAQTEAKNAAFEAMTHAQKRVAIAEDVLMWLRLGRIQAENGNYLSVETPPTLEPRTGRFVGGGVSSGVHEIDGMNCSACALGSVFAAVAERCPTGASLNSYTGDDMREQLAPYFSHPQLLEIEMAFEGFDAFDGHINTKATNYCADLPKYAKATQRMERIMRNIIANGGTFVP